MPLFLIFTSEDGVSIHPVEKAKLLADLDDGYYEDEQFLAELPPSDEYGYVLIEGEIVTPKPKATVTKYEL